MKLAEFLTSSQLEPNAWQTVRASVRDSFSDALRIRFEQLPLADEPSRDFAHALRSIYASNVFNVNLE